MHLISALMNFTLPHYMRNFRTPTVSRVIQNQQKYILIWKNTTAWRKNWLIRERITAFCSFLVIFGKQNLITWNKSLLLRLTDKATERFDRWTYRHQFQNLEYLNLKKYKNRRPSNRERFKIKIIDGDILGNLRTHVLSYVDDCSRHARLFVSEICNENWAEYLTIFHSVPC